MGEAKKKKENWKGDPYPSLGGEGRGTRSYLFTSMTCEIKEEEYEKVVDHQQMVLRKKEKGGTRPLSVRLKTRPPQCKRRGGEGGFPCRERREQARR